MSNNNENEFFQVHQDPMSINSNQSYSFQKQNINDSRENYSPFIIKRTGTIAHSTQTKTNFNNCYTSPSYKLYTPSPNLKEKLSDRFIPCKKGVNLLAQFEMTKSYNPQEEIKTNLEINLNNIDEFLNQAISSQTNVINSPLNTNNTVNNNNSNNLSNFTSPKDDLNRNQNYNELLRNSIFSEEAYTSLISNPTMSPNVENQIKPKIFRFKTESKKKPKIGNLDLNELINNFSYQQQECSVRKINKTPFKILDAPNLMDDFYLNLVDWSSQNDLSVGLLDSVYVWSANKSRVSKLCQYVNENYVSSVIWNPNGTHIAVGTSEGILDIWDVECRKKVRSLEGHTGRIGVISWARNVISTGSKDYNILNRDLRTFEPYYDKLSGHKQEVCGLKWSFDETQLASGGNDNKLFIWTQNSTQPLIRFSNHNAAVKAIAWSPHQNNLLASGGGINRINLGTADRCIRFWNTSTLQQIHYVDTGSQVCNLMFSKSSNEIVSTHGYSLNQIIIWKYPTMQKIATLTGHTYRVLYLAMSPDGQNIVTGAGDERLRFWNVFPQIKYNIDKTIGSSLFPSNTDIR